MPEQFTAALQRSHQISLTVTGRVTGRQISNPVSFVQEGDKIYLLPVRGSDTDWFKNVRATPSVRLTAEGASLTATAVPITDPARVHEVVEKLRAKSGDPDRFDAGYSKLDVAVEVSVPSSVA